VLLTPPTNRSTISLRHRCVAYSCPRCRMSRGRRRVWVLSAPFEGDGGVLGPALNLLSLVEGIRPIHPVRLEDGETGFSRLGAHPGVVVDEDRYLSALR
jgi:hypothetical protein